MKIRKFLLLCGILSSLLYLAMNIVFPFLYHGYDTVSQAISEFSAIGAPTRSLWIPAGHVYTLLVIAFGFGIWTSARGNRPLRAAGGAVIVYGLSGFAWPFASMHTREALAAGGGTFADVMHLVLGSLTGLIYLTMLGFGAAAFGKGFRIYSVATIAIFIGSSILVGIDGAKMGTNQPTPWLGVTERIMIGIVLLWVAVLSIILHGADEGRRVSD